jgi:hypothetical protein
LTGWTGGKLATVIPVLHKVRLYTTNSTC